MRTYRDSKRAGKEVIRIVAVYAIFGSAWIYFSGSALNWLVADPQLHATLEVYKGLFFILLTSALLFQLISNFAYRNAQTISQLAESEARFEAIYHSVNDALIIHDKAGDIVDVNRTMCEMFGYSREEALQVQTGDLSLGEFPFSRTEIRKRLELATQGTPQIFEWRSRKKDGTLFWTEINMRSADLNGKERVIVMLRDIGSRKQTEEALRQSEEILQVLMEEMPAGVGWSDQEGGIQFLNGCLIDWFEVTPAEVPTIDHLMLKVLDDSCRVRVLETWSTAIREARVRETPVPPIEAKVLFKDGSLRHVILNTRLVFDRILFIFTDISKWEAMQSDILKAQKLESLGVLAGGIAHDFNNILTGILGNISFAALQIDEKHPARRPLDNAEKASMRAAELAHQLLTFAKGGEPVKKPVSIGSLVHESLSLALHGSKVQPIVNVPAALHAVEADEGQINQAFNNVIINALQSMPQGGTLTVAAENVVLAGYNRQGLPAGDYVKISFTDGGSGISPENQKKIFDPYFTTKAGGTGLGLASVHSIVSKHSGRVEVDSSLGSGTTFTFFLPSHGKSLASSERTPAVATGQSCSTGSILVMDDEESIRALATSILEYLGFAVVTCGNGQEAVELYKAAKEAGHPFLAAIMDLTVPAGMGGKEAAERILGFDPSARLIVSSGYSNDPVMANFTDHGFRAAVVKPYRCAEIQRALEAE